MQKQMKPRDKSLVEILEEFEFLVADFGFSKPQISHAGPISSVAEYKRSEIIVQLDIDWREGHFWVFLRRPGDRDRWVGGEGFIAISERPPFEGCRETPEIAKVRKKGNGGEGFRVIVNGQSRMLHCLLLTSSDWLRDFFDDVKLL